MTRERFFTGAPWEQKVGYCRAICVDKQIYISGTTALDDQGNLVGKGDAYEQTKRCFAIVENTLQRFNASLVDVVRTRMFVTDIRQWELIGRAHHDCFGKNPPATTMVEVKGLIKPDMLIEIEVDAVKY